MGLDKIACKSALLENEIADKMNVSDKQNILMLCKKVDWSVKIDEKNSTERINAPNLTDFRNRRCITLLDHFRIITKSILIMSVCLWYLLLLCANSQFTLTSGRMELIEVNYYRTDVALLKKIESYRSGQKLNENKKSKNWKIVWKHVFPWNDFKIFVYRFLQLPPVLVDVIPYAVFRPSCRTRESSPKFWKQPE